MSTRCKFSKCGWTGHPDYLFDHCEMGHGHFIREIEEGSKFELTFEDVLETETLLLHGNNGLYWFTQTVNEEPDGFAKGIFAIGPSEVVNYTLEIGSRARGNFHYHLGPYQVQPENSNYFQLFFSFEYVEFINKHLDHKMTLYLQGHTNSTTYAGGSTCAIQARAAEEKLNEEYLKTFTCNICLDYIRKDARFCENRHFLCDICYRELMRRNTTNCPVCRGKYFRDCQSQDVENLLKTLKFPD